MDLKFKKLAFQKNKFQLIWTSYDTSNQLLDRLQFWDSFYSVLFLLFSRPNDIQMF